MQRKKHPNDINFNGGNFSFTSTVIQDISPEERIEENLPTEKILLLPLFDTVVFPDLPQPVKLSNDLMVETALEASEKNLFVAAFYVFGEEKEIFDQKKLSTIGTLGKTIKVVPLPDSQQIAFLSGTKRVKLRKVVKKGRFYYADVELIPEVKNPKRLSGEHKLLLSEIDTMYESALKFLPEPPDQEYIQLKTENEPASIVKKIYGMAITSPLSPEEKDEVLAENTFMGLLESFLRNMDIAVQRLNLQASIHMRTHQELSMQQKEMFLKQQIKHIQEELGEGNALPEENELIERAKKMKWSKEAAEHFYKEHSKLERLNSMNPEYSVQFSYLETLLELPWENYSKENFTLQKVEKILDRDHYGLETVKERIIEQMAVIKLRKDNKAPIICLFGPPGVGKTSLGKSIADALGREYARISLGGVNDEAEIRGHRRTYIGAMPGRIISALSKCKSGNPVIVLDEVDKLGTGFKGDPSTALLEVLDPEQNTTFHDNYIDFDYDLSKVLFIATANNLGSISGPLLDRMEIIELGSYIPEEKIEIAARHLVPKTLVENGFEKNEIKFNRPALSYIINRYTRESGVRQLEKKLNKVLRKIARLKASGKEFPKTINETQIKEFLGKEEVNPEIYENNNFAGVVTGLAWTPMGGEILFIESSISPGKGDKITLTGNLGDVMKESAVIALQYLKAHAKRLNLDPEFFSKVDLHVHVPEGAVPKDGPSAGITIATSIASAFLGRKVKERTAMTGEITLRGKVLPVGGIKEKILAAKRAGITDVILSCENKKDIEEINEKYLKGLSFHFVDTIEDVIEIALLPEKAKYHYDFN